MHDCMLRGFNKGENSFETLKRELSSVKDDIRMIEGMKVPEEAKSPILAELQKQISEIKEKMHDCIDSL